ncbi:MAG: ectoine/hydroxyectoine ABC transporter substrate-binding protein EhuB [Dehalococcoidia bacterium]|nr:ectoine/hydroxyectoine ABC transporter substrate-binding protein EhuB [Dehalococcoidia bacterium]
MTNPEANQHPDDETILGRRVGRRTLFRGFTLAGLGLAGAAMIGCSDSGDDDSGDGGDAEATETMAATGEATGTMEATGTSESSGGEASAGGTLAKAREQGYITIGFANEAPYGFADSSGEVTGEAPEVAKAIFAELGIPEVQGVVTTFGSLIPGLQAGRFDVIAAGMFINPDRCGQILFSDPDYCIPQAFAVPAGNPMGLMNYEDVANSDAQIGVLSGGVEEGYALDLGVPEDRITRFDEATSLAEGLQAGRVDVIAATSLSIRAQLDRLNDDSLEMTAGFTPVIDGQPQRGCGGYGFRQEDQELRDAFNDVLAQMKGEDQIVGITEEFGFGSTEIDAAKDVTAEDLCTPAS